MSGEVFLFLGRNRSLIKILHWEDGGFVLYQKKLERGTFEVPRFNPSNNEFEMKWKTFVLINGGRLGPFGKVQEKVLDKD